MGSDGMRIFRMAPLTLLAALSACTPDAENFGVNSVHQPVVTGNQAHVPNCPDWRSAGRDSAATTDTNYGCAVNSNITAMVANPGDLLHGRTTDSSDAANTVKAVKAWNSMEATSKLYQITTKESAASGGGPQ